MYVYQLAVLLILVSLSCWAIAGLGIFDHVWPANRTSWGYKAIATGLFTLASITLRECWHVVVGSQAMLLVRLKLGERREKD